MEQPILSVRNMTSKLLLQGKKWPCCQNINFDLYPGKTLALVGESGCGKTMTALSLLSLALSPPAEAATGEVIFHGKNLLALSERELRKVRGGKIAMIFQDPSSSFNPLYTIGNQLMEAALAHLNIDEEEAFASALQALKDVGMADAEHRMDEYPHQLSGGMKQRAMIAMAMLCNPEVIIADEPTTALDVTIQAQVLDLLRGLQKKRGLALLLITHDLGVVAEIADDVAVMYATEIVETGPVKRIFESPSHPYTKALFHAFSRTRNEKGELSTIKGSVPSLQHLPKGCKFHTRCPFAFERCRHEKPPPFKIKGENDRYSSCWLEDKDD